MPIPARFSNALHNEFTAFYDVSELPDSWDEWMANLEEEAAASASRMRDWVDGDTHIAELAEFLRTASQERRGELIRQVQKWTRFAWGNEE